MDHRYLGASGLLVSELCLGTMTFGGEADEAASRGLLDHYAEAGGNFIDSADVYGGGTSEEIVGRWLTGRDRDALVIATKFFWPTGDGPNDHGAAASTSSARCTPACAGWAPTTSTCTRCTPSTSPPR